MSFSPSSHNWSIPRYSSSMSSLWTNNFLFLGKVWATVAACWLPDVLFASELTKSSDGKGRLAAGFFFGAAIVNLSAGWGALRKGLPEPRSSSLIFCNQTQKAHQQKHTCFVSENQPFGIQTYQYEVFPANPYNVLWWHAAQTESCWFFLGAVKVMLRNIFCLS